MPGRALLELEDEAPDRPARAVDRERDRARRRALGVRGPGDAHALVGQLGQVGAERQRLERASPAPGAA